MCVCVCGGGGGVPSIVSSVGRPPPQRAVALYSVQEVSLRSVFNRLLRVYVSTCWRLAFGLFASIWREWHRYHNRNVARSLAQPRQGGRGGGSFPIRVKLTTRWRISFSFSLMRVACFAVVARVSLLTLDRKWKNRQCPLFLFFFSLSFSFCGLITVEDVEHVASPCVYWDSVTHSASTE